MKQKIKVLYEMYPNKEKDKCARCKEGIGEIPICSDECDGSIWICEECDKELF
jgi:hypothetical protein